MSPITDAKTIADRPATLTILAEHTRFDGFRKLDDVRFRYDDKAASHAPGEFSRETARVGDVAALLPYDPVRDLLVLQRQMRIAAHLANGHGEMVEIVAGLIDPGEDAEHCARREAKEEAGLTVRRVVDTGLRYVATPGFSTEYAQLFCGEVDARDAASVAGEAHEGEYIEPIVVTVEAALAALDAGYLHNSYTIIALSWFARHHQRVRAQWQE